MEKKTSDICITWLQRASRKPYLTILLAVVAALLLTTGGTPVYAQLKITKAEVNQVLGVQKDNHEYYVAGKHTVVRAFLSQPVTIDPTKTSVEVSKNGKSAFKMAPKKTEGSVSTVDFLCATLADCQNWAAGNYSFNISVNSKPYDASGPYAFAAGNTFRLLAVPIKANYGSGGIKPVAGEKWKNFGQFTEMVYPLANKALGWTNRQGEFNASAALYNLEKSDWSGCDALAAALAKLIPVTCKTNPKAKGCYDYVVGFVEDSIVMDNGKSLAGFAPFGQPIVVVVAGSDDAPATVAHEIAHKFGIGDTYDDQTLSSIRCSVNPAPNGFKGRNWDDNFKEFNGCTDGRLASTLKDASGELINGAQVTEASHPYEIGGRGPLLEMVDFMAASGPVGPFQNQFWITADNYDWLYRRLVNNEPDPSPMLSRSILAAAPQRFLSFSGTLSKAGAVTLEPWQSYTDAADLNDTSGSLMIRALDGTGATVASTAFKVQFFMVHPPRDIDPAPFNGVVRFPTGTAKFQIVKDASVMIEVPVSANPPTVASVSPTTPTTINGPYNITWTSNDPDGGTLTYTVEYNSDITNADFPWMVLAADLDTTSWQEDFSELPGGANANIRVTASDGVLADSAVSAVFIVPSKKPEVFMDDLPWGTVYPAGSPVLFLAEAYDPQDGWLPDSQLNWTSNISGVLGYGSELLAGNLDPGRHTVTLTATNSAGLSTSSVTNVTIQQPIVAGGGSSGCFIATAAYGSYFHPFVAILRDFRDTVLLSFSLGRSFVAWYYRVSPSIADTIRTSEIMKAGVRIALFPVVGASYLSLAIGVVPTLFILVLLPAVICLSIRKLYQYRRTA